jgi:hypothetical protein
MDHGYNSRVVRRSCAWRSAVAAHPKSLTPSHGGGDRRIRYASAAQHGALQDEDIVTRLQKGDFDMLVALAATAPCCGRASVRRQQVRPGHQSRPFRLSDGGPPDQWRPVLERILVGDYWVERRMMRAEHQSADGQVRSLGGAQRVRCRTVVARPVRLTAEIDGRYLTTYAADGVIAARATGSTACPRRRRPILLRRRVTSCSSPRPTFRSIERSS